MSALSNISGRVWVLGDNIDTDAMAPGVSMMLDWPAPRQHMFPAAQRFH